MKGRRKPVLSIVLLSVMLFPLCAAAKSSHSFESDAFFPQNACSAGYRFDCLWEGNDTVSYGFMLSAGYGIEHFTRFGSNALICGPYLETGPEIGIACGNGITWHVYVSAVASYPLYPDILRGAAGADIRFALGGSFFAGLGAGVLFPAWNARIRVILGAGL